MIVCFVCFIIIYFIYLFYFSEEQEISISETPVKSDYHLSESKEQVSIPIFDPSTATTAIPFVSNPSNYQLVLDNYAQLNHEYVRRKYRKRYDNPEKLRDLLTEHTTTLDQLKTAVEGRMDLAVVGILNSIIQVLDPLSNLASNSAHASVNTSQLIEFSYSKATIDPGDHQRTFFRANVCAMIAYTLRELGGQVSVCEKALLAVAYLCRYSDENKSSVCLENCKGFGLHGVCELIVGAIKRHKAQAKILEVACDAIRSLCALESNRDRLGQVGACEVMARALVSYVNDLELTRWICRALGHLSNRHVENSTIIGQNGACQNLIIAIQKYPLSLELCVEACWAIRQLALNHFDNKMRLLNDYVIESILAVYKTHFANEAFVLEANRVFVNILTPIVDSKGKQVAAKTEEKDPDEQVLSDDEARDAALSVTKSLPGAINMTDLITTLVNAGYINLSMKSLKKCPDNEDVPRFIFNVLYYVASVGASSIASNPEAKKASAAASEKNAIANAQLTALVATITSRLLNSELLDNLSHSLENHAGTEAMAEWGCRLVHKLTLLKSDNIHSKLRIAGINEMVTSAVQRQAISPVVCSIGCLVIGDLAHDESNIPRLSSAGSMEAAVGALKRHHQNIDVIYNACYAIHYLANGNSNNIAWLGAYGACEAIINALQKHYMSSPLVVKYAMNALGSLAFHNDGNQAKILNGSGCAIIVQTLLTHLKHSSIVESIFRCVYHLCEDHNCVNEFGKQNICDSIVQAIQLHGSKVTVMIQLFHATAYLAVKIKLQKVHKKNTHVLIHSGVLENILVILQRYLANPQLCIAACSALSSLIRVDKNQKALSQLGIFEVIVNILKTHMNNAMVLEKAFVLIFYLISRPVSLALPSPPSASRVTAPPLPTDASALPDLYASVETTNKLKCLELKFIDVLLSALVKHEKEADMIASTFQVIVELSSLFFQHPGINAQLFSDEHIKMYLKLIKIHEKIPGIALQGSVLLQTICQLNAKPVQNTVATLGELKSNNDFKLILCKYKGPDLVLSLLTKHYKECPSPVFLHATCNSLVALSKIPAAFEALQSSEVCQLLLDVLKEYFAQIEVCESILRAILSISMFPHNRNKLGTKDIASLLTNTMNEHRNHPMIIILSGELIDHLCSSSLPSPVVPSASSSTSHHASSSSSALKTNTNNQYLFSQQSNLFPLLLSLYGDHLFDLKVMIALNKAIASLLYQQVDLCNKILDLGILPLIYRCLAIHLYNPMLVQYACSLLTSLTSKANPKGIAALGSFLTSEDRLHANLINDLPPHNGVMDDASASSVWEKSLLFVLNKALFVHYMTFPTCVQIVRSLRGILQLSTSTLTSTAAASSASSNTAPVKDPMGYKDSTAFDKDTLVQKLNKCSCFVPLLIDTLTFHESHDTVVEHVSFILGVLEYKFNKGSMKRLQSMQTYETIQSIASTSSPGNLPIEPSSNSERVITAPADKVGATLHSYYNVTPRFFYSQTSHFELFLRLLSNYEEKPNILRQICSMIGHFAEKNKQPHVDLVKSLYSLVEANIKASIGENAVPRNDAVISKLLFALTALMKGHLENNRQAMDLGLTRLVDHLFREYTEGNVLIYGLFPVLHAMVSVSENIPSFLANTKHIITSLNKILYNELENDFISQFGCMIVTGFIVNSPSVASSSAVASSVSVAKSSPIGKNLGYESLTHNVTYNKRYQIKLSPVCNYIADLVNYHKTNHIILTEAYRCISALCHNNITNRNRLGTSDACSAIMGVVQTSFSSVNMHYLEEIMSNSTWAKIENSMLYWLIRAVADLSANHPNNSGKLAQYGACDLLVKVLQLKRSNPAETHIEAKVFANVFWAIGNLVQYHSTPSGTLSNLNQSTTGNMPSNASADQLTPLSPSPATTAAASVASVGRALAGNKDNSITKTMKNTTRFFELQIAQFALAVLKNYLHYPVTIQWTCRAINNLIKNSNRLRVDFVDQGLRDHLSGIVEKYNNEVANDNDAVEVLFWANAITDTLASSESS